MDRILLFGGSFDPIHNGHLIVSRHAAEQLGMARVILVPSASPPHKQGQQLASACDRLTMCRLAIADEPLFEVSDWETRQPGPNYTIDTVAHFRAVSGPRSELYWLVGMDILGELNAWYRATELVDLCTIVTAARPGFEPPATQVLAARFSAAQIDKLMAHVTNGPRIDIAGREIRERVRTGRSIRYLVPEGVRQHIVERGLYRE